MFSSFSCAVPRRCLIYGAGNKKADFKFCHITGKKSQELQQRVANN
jgi:hypothetical protein